MVIKVVKNFSFRTRDHVLQLQINTYLLNGGQLIPLLVVYVTSFVDNDYFFHGDLGTLEFAIMCLTLLDASVVCDCLGVGCPSCDWVVVAGTGIEGECGRRSRK